MDSIPLEMDDIFDEDGQDFNPARLPDLEDELEPMRNMMHASDNDEGDEDGEQPATDDPELLAKLKSMKGASKLTAKRTMPKLDETRLTGERGIPVLPKVFQDIHLKGKNHEVEDLKAIVRRLEHWGHRLFPKMPFAEVLERVERLGAKKAVQTCVKKIRLDMLEMPEDREDEDDVQRAGDTQQEVQVDEDEIEDLLREQETYDRQHGHSDDDDPFHTTFQTEQSAKSESNEQEKTVISDDVKARIERNKQLAMERRAARLAKTTDGTSITTGVVSDHSSSSGTQPQQNGQLSLNEEPSNMDLVVGDTSSKKAEKVDEQDNSLCDNDVDNLEREHSERVQDTSETELQSEGRELEKQTDQSVQDENDSIAVA
ncbi:TIMELESS-interacting protein [Aplysia californica]|uniref:TIMELESS-interacting protein n=1 Tax=Aplysia californica TaxID=6500 RepID=A0ABM0JNY6_APLCA|nr:TIMELESS-interacting protein [Aplysia californica]XP_012937827.1 TIMELESS-interacting protein [Aplysia californica]